MAEVCGVGLKNLRANFRVEELFSARNVSRYFPVWKNSGYINTEPDNFMDDLDYPVWPRCFFICARNSDEDFTKFIVNFPLFHFYNIANWNSDEYFTKFHAIFPNWNIYINLNNCRNCFFMLCSYKNSCLCFVAININVRFKVNTEFHISRCRSNKYDLISF